MGAGPSHMKDNMQVAQLQHLYYNVNCIITGAIIIIITNEQIPMELLWLASIIQLCGVNLL